MRCRVKFPVPFEVEGGGANVASELAVVVVRSKMFLQRNPKRKLSLAHRTWIRTLNYNKKFYEKLVLEIKLVV